MKKMLGISALICISSLVFGQARFQQDVIPTESGDITITFIGHASILMEWDDQTIYFDPSSREANFYKLPKATMIFVTHEHGDHCDPSALKAISEDNTKTFMSSLAHEKWGQGMILYPDQDITVNNIRIEVLPAYNLVHEREDGSPYHIKGEGNSYIITLGGKRIFVGGDTENTPEMKAMKNIDIAFLPMNLPYTMTPEMVADGAKAFRPEILYPYHYSKTDLDQLRKLMEEEEDIELRIRKF